MTGPIHGPIELKPHQSRGIKLIGAVVLAAFWNGILSVFVWQAVQAWTQSQSDWIEKWFLPIFLIPFVLIGLAMIGAVVYCFLGLFNPRPRLFLQAASASLGDTIQIQWRIDGRLQVLQRLRVFLQGREEAVYRRGTRTYTDKEIFATLELANVTSRADMRSGQACLHIPLDTMHSFTGTNNKIIWTLHVRGDIQRWPDVDDEFPFTVLPAQATIPPRA